MQLCITLCTLCAAISRVINVQNHPEADIWPGLADVRCAEQDTYLLATQQGAVLSAELDLARQHGLLPDSPAAPRQQACLYASCCCEETHAQSFSVIITKDVSCSGVCVLGCQCSHCRPCPLHRCYRCLRWTSRQLGLRADQPAAVETQACHTTVTVHRSCCIEHQHRLQMRQHVC